METKCHVLARNLAGKFSSIEEIEGKALFSFVNKIENARTNQVKLKVAIEFAEQCMTATKSNLPAATLRGEQASIHRKTRNQEAAEAANALCLAKIPIGCRIKYIDRVCNPAFSHAKLVSCC